MIQALWANRGSLVRLSYRSGEGVSPERQREHSGGLLLCPPENRNEHRREYADRYRYGDAHGCTKAVKTSMNSLASLIDPKRSGNDGPYFKAPDGLNSLDKFRATTSIRHPAGFDLLNRSVMPVDSTLSESM